MPRKVRNTILLAKIETTAGTDAVPTGAANALLASSPSFLVTMNNVSRDLVRGYFGADEELVGTRYVECSFEVELSGSGVAGTAPAYGPLLRACTLAEVVTAGQRVEYTPVSSGLETLTLYYHQDGLLYKALGCMGTVEFKMGLGERPMLAFRFLGIDGGRVATANPLPTLTAWKKPVVITDVSAGDITLGCTYATGALSGGTTYSSRGLSVTLGNEVKHLPLLGGDVIDITGRETTGACELDLTAANEATFMADVVANTTTSLGFSFGTAAGARVLIHAPNVQRLAPKASNVDGNLMVGMDLRFLPNSGNDDFRLVVS